MSTSNKTENKTETSNKSSSTKSRKREISKEVRDELSFTEKLEEFQTKFHELTKELRSLETTVKALEKAYNQDLQLVHKSKNKRNGERKKTGFVLRILLPDGMAKLIGEKKGTYMSLPEYTKRFYQVLDERNLRYAENKKVFRADDEMMRVFNLPKSVNNSTNPSDKDGFNFHTLQKIFSQVCKGAPREDPKVEEKEVPPTPKETQKEVPKEKAKVTVKGKKKEPVADA